MEVPIKLPEFTSFAHLHTWTQPSSRATHRDPQQEMQGRDPTGQGARTSQDPQNSPLQGGHPKRVPDKPTNPPLLGQRGVQAGGAVKSFSRSPRLGGGSPAAGRASCPLASEGRGAGGTRGVRTAPQRPWWAAGAPRAPPGRGRCWGRGSRCGASGRGVLGWGCGDGGELRRVMGWERGKARWAQGVAPLHLGAGGAAPSRPPSAERPRQGHEWAGGVLSTAHK